MRKSVVLLMAVVFCAMSAMAHGPRRGCCGYGYAGRDSVGVNGWHCGEPCEDEELQVLRWQRGDNDALTVRCRMDANTGGLPRRTDVASATLSAGGKKYNATDVDVIKNGRGYIVVDYTFSDVPSFTGTAVISVLTPWGEYYAPLPKVQKIWPIGREY